jgi:hypothetical protein
LPPRPECKAITIAFSSLFELVWWLPEIWLSKLLLIRDLLASAEEMPQISHASAMNRQWFAHITPERSRGAKAVATLVWPKDFMPSNIVCIGKNFGDH